MNDFAFHYEHDGTLSIESAVFQTLGAASTCWENMSGTGVFDSERAKQIGEKLLEFLAAESAAPRELHGDFVKRDGTHSDTYTLPSSPPAEPPNEQNTFNDTRYAIHDGDEYERLRAPEGHAASLAAALRPLAEYPVMESMRGRGAWICRADAPNGEAVGISVEDVFAAREALAAYTRGDAE